MTTSESRLLGLVAAVKIRMLQPSDVPACMGIAALSWDRLIGGMAQADLNEAFGTSPWRPVFYVAEVQGGVVGFAAYGCSWLGYCIYSLTWVNVHPDFQGRGIGTALIERCLHDLRPLARVVILITEKAAALYERFGFKPLAKYASENGGGKETLMALDFTEAARSAGGWANVCEWPSCAQGGRGHCATRSGPCTEPAPVATKPTRREATTQCPECHGQGFKAICTFGTSDMAPCSACAGTGRISAVEAPTLSHPADPQAHKIDALNRVARPEEPARAAGDDQTVTKSAGGTAHDQQCPPQGKNADTSPVPKDASHVPPCPNTWHDAPEALGAFCPVCGAVGSAPSQEGRAGELRACPFCGTGLLKRERSAFHPNNGCIFYDASGDGEIDESYYKDWNNRAPLEKPSGEAGDAEWSEIMARPGLEQREPHAMLVRMVADRYEFADLPDGNYIAGKRVTVAVDADVQDLINRLYALDPSEENSAIAQEAANMLDTLEWGNADLRQGLEMAQAELARLQSTGGTK